MLEALQRSINALDARCCKEGRRFRHHVDGPIPTTPPSNEEFDLYVIHVDEWNKMSRNDRVALWGTGCDIFVRGTKAVGPEMAFEERIAGLHSLDEPMQVQGKACLIPFPS